MFQQLKSSSLSVAKLLYDTNIDASELKAFILLLFSYIRLFGESNGDRAIATISDHHRLHTPEAHWQEMRKATLDMGHTIKSALHVADAHLRQSEIYHHSEFVDKDERHVHHCNKGVSKCR
jgi:hypothetical protein